MLDVRHAGEACCDAACVAREEVSVRSDVEGESDVGDYKEGAGCEGDGAAFVVGIEDGFGGLLPEGGPGAEGAACGCQ